MIDRVKHSPSQFGGTCVTCHEWYKTGEEVFYWRQGQRWVRAHYPDCGPDGPGRRAIPLPLPITPAPVAVSGPGSTGVLTPEKPEGSGKRGGFVQIAAWVPASQASKLLACIAEIHGSEDHPSEGGRA